MRDIAAVRDIAALRDIAAVQGIEATGGVPVASRPKITSAAYACRSILSGENVISDLPSDIGKPKISSSVAVG